MTEKKGTDWMYNPVSEINRDEYLLGKKVGKDFDADGTMGKINDVGKGSFEIALNEVHFGPQ